MANAVLDERPPVQDRFIRYDQLRQFGIDYSRQHLTVLEQQGAFPKRVQLSPRAIAWRLSDLQNWMRTRSQKQENPARNGPSGAKPVPA